MGVSGEIVQRPCDGQSYPEWEYGIEGAGRVVRCALGVPSRVVSAEWHGMGESRLVVHARSGHSEGNWAFETGGLQASDEPEHGVGPQHVALASNGLEHGACCWTRSGSLRTSSRKEAAVWKVL